MADEDEDRDTLLQFLFSEVVEPKIGQEAPVRFIISLLPKPRLHNLAQKIAVWQNVLSSIIKA